MALARRMWLGQDDEMLRWLMTPLSSPFHMETMPADLVEKRDAYELTISVPDFEEKDIQIQWRNGVLMVSAQRAHHHSVKDGKWHWQERRSSSSMSRSFHLPFNANADNATATLRNGVLRMRIPKSSNTAPSKTIPIRKS